MRTQSHLLLIGLLLATACTESDPADDDPTAETEAEDTSGDAGETEAASDEETGTEPETSSTTSTEPPPGPSATDDPACEEAYAFCGDIIVPADLAGTPRSLGIALYTTVPPAGPPDAIVAEIEAPELVPGERFPVVVVPVLDQGEYYVWINLYMEGGGMFIPAPGVDYYAVTDAPVQLDGGPLSFGELTLSVVE